MNTHVNLEKEFVPFTESLELKQLGFDIPSVSGFSYPDSDNLLTQAILYQQAFRWFREKYGLRIRNYGSINYSGDLSEYFEIFKYGYGTSDKTLSIKIGALTYEEAELACMRKLIEILKTKQ